MSKGQPVAIRRRAQAAGIAILGTMGLPKNKGLASPDAAVRKDTVTFLKAAAARAVPVAGGAGEGRDDVAAEPDPVRMKR
jgi:hypothetical protein